MIHPKFGNKFTCHACAAKYYDMKKPDPKCPKCGADPKDDPALKASEKGSKKGLKDEPEADEFEEEKFESDMDELVADDDAEAEEEGEEEVSGGGDEE